MPSLPNPIKIATKGAEIGFQVGTFVAGQALERVQSLLDKDGGDGDGDQARYAPTTPPERKLESVPTGGTTSTGAKPTTARSTATGPGGTRRTAPKAPKTAATPKRQAPAAREEAPAEKEITARPSTGGTKGETSTTVKAKPRTGPRSAGGRISNPKAAKKARARSAGAAAKTGAGAKTGQAPGAPTAAARTGDLSGAKGKGGRPATVKAENSPAELADGKQGKQAAPLGTDS